jgi:hypothetical protein
MYPVNKHDNTEKNTALVIIKDSMTKYLALSIKAEKAGGTLAENDKKPILDSLQSDLAKVCPKLNLCFEKSVMADVLLELSLYVTSFQCNNYKIPAGAFFNLGDIYANKILGLLQSNPTSRFVSTPSLS